MGHPAGAQRKLRLFPSDALVEVQTAKTDVGRNHGSTAFRKARCGFLFRAWGILALIGCGDKGSGRRSRGMDGAQRERRSLPSGEQTTHLGGTGCGA